MFTVRVAFAVPSQVAVPLACPFIHTSCRTIENVPTAKRRSSRMAVSGFGFLDETVAAREAHFTAHELLIVNLTDCIGEKVPGGPLKAHTVSVVEAVVLACLPILPLLIIRPMTHRDAKKVRATGPGMLFKHIFSVEGPHGMVHMVRGRTHG